MTFLNAENYFIKLLYALTLCFTLITPSSANGPPSVADLADGLLDAVVNISTSQQIKPRENTLNTSPNLSDDSFFKEFFDHNKKSPNFESLGSGFVVDAKEGIIVTNSHVISDADEIKITFTNGKALRATLVGKDLTTDLAVLKVDPQKFPLKAVKFGNSDQARIGDWVIAIGNPFGLGGTVTVGIISGRNRDLNAGPYDRFIQTDAAINKGNSGGPLFNMKGEVIGINSAIISPTGGSIGLAFSIPAELALGVVKQLRAFGETRRGWLGVRTQPVTEDIADILGLENIQGVLVSGIVSDEMRDTHLQMGDIITKIGTQNIKDLRDLSLVMSEHTVGEKINLSIIRKKLPLTISVMLQKLEESETVKYTKNDQHIFQILGMSLQDLDDANSQKFGISGDVKGILIVDVSPNSLAFHKNIKAGDVISEVNNQIVYTAYDFAREVETLTKNLNKNIVLMVTAPTGEKRFITLVTE